MMKRRRLLITGVLLLLGGAIVNVAVAWGCAYKEIGASGMDCVHEAHPRQSIYGDCFLCFQFRVGSTRLSVNRGDADLEGGWRDVPSLRVVVPRWADWTLRSYQSDVIWNPQQSRRREVQGNGWPCIALTGSFDLDHRVSSIVNVQSAIILDAPIYVGVGPLLNASPILPLRPVWPGFAINTIFYAAILWVVWFTSGMVRRRIRRMRGQCPACAYPIGTSPVCTECGGSVRGVSKA